MRGLLLVLVVAGCSPNVVRYGELHRDSVARVVDEVARVRGLPPLRPIGFHLVGEKRLRADFAADLSRDQDTGQMARRKQYWATLGLVPWSLDLRAHYDELYQQLPAGYYEDEDSGVKVVLRGTLRSEVTEIAGLLSGRDKTYGETLAHEVVHALQDQHFDLDVVQAGDGTDARNARRALVEGDAFLAAFQVDEPLLFRDVHQFTRLVQRIFRARRGASPTWAETVFLFPYVHGTRFVAALFERGGWPAVNAAMAAPPNTTAEILHPERYLDRERPPARHDLSSLRNWLAGSWTALVEEAVGELAIRFLLHEETDAAEIAAGWLGGAALVLEKSGGSGEMALVWSSRWSDAGVAGRFADGYRRRMKAVRREGVAVRRYGQVVVVVAGLDEQSTARAQDLALRGTGGRSPSPGRPARRVPPPIEGSGTDHPVRIDAMLDVEGAADGPIFSWKGPSSRLALHGIVQYRVDRRDGFSPSHLLPRAYVGASGVIEPLLDLGFRLGIELSPTPAEPTLAGSRPESRSPGVLQDASLRMRLTSVGLPDVGAFSFGRRRSPLFLSGRTRAGDMALSTRPIPWDRDAGHLLPERDLGFAYEVDYSSHGVPLGISLAAGEALQGARLSVMGATASAPRPRLEGGVVFARRTPVGAGDAFSMLAADVAARYRGLRLEGTAALLNPDAGADGYVLSVMGALQPLPDFLELALRWERLRTKSVVPFGDLDRLTWGVSLHYLAGRFRLAVDREHQWSDEAGETLPSTSRFLVSLDF